MKLISEYNTSANQRSITAENRIEKLIPMLKDCFKHMHVIDTVCLKDEVISALENILCESQLRRTEFENE